MERLKKDKRKKGGSAIATLGGSRTGAGATAVEISAPTSVKQGKEELKESSQSSTKVRLTGYNTTLDKVLHVNQKFQWVNQDPAEDFILLQKV